ncbi:MAG: DoxX family protein [Patescibacteria group bacterium]
MKAQKIAYWITTTIIFLMEGVLVALTGWSQMSIDGIVGLGYPLYFVSLLATFKILGSIVLMFPQFPRNMKEWAYAGFGIDFISAFVSIWAVAGFGPMLILPAAFMIILAISYKSYTRLSLN